jgi:uncharacterized protein YprB with RNaseH-like and TPR domain
MSLYNAKQHASDDPGLHSFGMLAFDIETEGLDSRFCDIIVASVYDPHRNIQRTFNFASDESKAAQFIQTLDDAPRLCCFNGVRFDIPFIAKR